MTGGSCVVITPVKQIRSGRLKKTPSQEITMRKASGVRSHSSAFFGLPLRLACALPVIAPTQPTLQQPGKAGNYIAHVRNRRIMAARLMKTSEERDVARTSGDRARGVLPKPSSLGADRAGSSPDSSFYLG